MLKYLLILFVIAVALAPLTHFLPSKRQRLIARMREYAAVHGLFVEFRDLPARERSHERKERKQQNIYYGKRLPPSPKESRKRTAWIRDESGWMSLSRKVAAPAALESMPASILAASLDEGSCGVYWREAGDEADVELIVVGLQAWQDEL
ncbi:MAG: hypothetical protein ABJN62_14285 [Halioglobus sp.]